MAENLNEIFLARCLENSVDDVQSCLSQGADVNTVSQDGCWSGLTWTAHKNHTKLLDILLSHPDIEVNKTTDAKDSGGFGQWTPLMFACVAGNPAIVSRLVQVEGLDINYQDHYGHTASHRACHTECVRLLALTGRVDWNIRDNYGYTPLYNALEEGRSDIVDIITQQPNIDYNVKTEGGDTLAQVAVRRGDVKCVETLAGLEKCDCWNVPYNNGDTPVMMALQRCLTEILEILVRCPRVDLTCRDKEGWSLVFTAISSREIGKCSNISKCSYINRIHYRSCEDNSVQVEQELHRHQPGPHCRGGGGGGGHQAPGPVRACGLD